MFAFGSLSSVGRSFLMGLLLIMWHWAFAFGFLMRFLLRMFAFGSLSVGEGIAMRFLWSTISYLIFAFVFSVGACWRH